MRHPKAAVALWYCPGAQAVQALRPALGL
jgi:hypothetical protein